MNEKDWRSWQPELGPDVQPPNVITAPSVWQELIPPPGEWDPNSLLFRPPVTSTTTSTSVVMNGWCEQCGERSGTESWCTFGLTGARFARWCKVCVLQDRVRAMRLQVAVLQELESELNGLLAQEAADRAAEGDK